MYGLRIDLQRVEAALREEGVTAFCTDDDDRLVVAAAGGHDQRDVQRVAAAGCRPARGAVRAVTVAELPLLPSGKPDYQAVRAWLAAPTTRRHPAAPARAVRRRAADRRRTHRPRRRASSTSAATRCRTWRCRCGWSARSANSQRTGNAVPSAPNWSAPRPPPRRSWPWLGATLETSVALRAAAIVLIVGSHAALYEMWGGAHLLLGIAGYNFGRFCLTPVPRTDRVRHLRNTIAWIAVPSVFVDRGRPADHRRLPLDESVAGQQVPRPARQHDRGPPVVRRGAGVDSGGADTGGLAADRGPAGTTTPVRGRRGVPGLRTGAAL